MHGVWAWRRGALTAGIVLVLVGLVAGTAWAEGDLRIEANTAYELPAEGDRLEVTVDLALTNLKADGRSGYSFIRYYFDSYRMLLPLEATNLSAVDPDGRSLTIEQEIIPIGEDGDHAQAVTVHFPRWLFRNRTQEITFRFDLVGGEPRSDSSVRVNPAYAAFSVWAWGDPGLSNVTISIPADYEVRFAGSDLVTRTADGSTSWYRNAIPDPGDWLVFFTARRDAALTSTSVIVDGLEIRVRSWPGDDSWADRVTGVVRRGVPELQRLVGLDFGGQQTLDILQALDPSLVGYAGWYILDEDVIELGEDLDDHVIIHEISHLWFNDDLFAERWITEGLAEDFAADVVDTLNLAANPAYGTHRRPLTTSSSAVALNDWIFPYSAPAGDEKTARREEYGYNASFYVVSTLRDEIGDEAMIAVLRAAADDAIAYRSGLPAETVAPDDDWRRFLDLLVEVGGSSNAEQLFADYVISEDESALLEDRAAARSAYAALLEADGTWDTPIAVRRPMSSWEFTDALERITAAERLLTLHAEVAALALHLDLTPPASLADGYAGATTLEDLVVAAALGEAQVGAITAVGQARDALDADRDFFTRVGLWGEDPDAAWQQAADAFVADDSAGAVALSADLVDLLAGAREVGTTRVMWAGGGALVVVILIALGIWLLRRRRSSQTAGEPTDTAGAPDES